MRTEQDRDQFLSDLQKRRSGIGHPYDAVEEVITLNLKSVKVEIWHNTQHLRTTFPDGATLGASPQNNDEYTNHARELGYADPWPMCYEHEIMHTLLAQHRGLEFSTALYNAAKGNVHDLNDYVEEEDVLLLQKLIRKGRTDLLRSSFLNVIYETFKKAI